MSVANFWVNGRAIDHMPLSDRSFQYGDGCFTTMLTIDGQIQHWAYHQDRMRHALSRLAIPEPDWQSIETWLEQVVLPHGRGGIKWHVSRGHGGRGYGCAGVSEPAHTMSHFAYPAHYLDWQQAGIALGVCATPLGINPLLAGIKHNNRLEQILCKAEMEQAGYVDGVTINVQSHVIETTMANLFWVTKGQWFTPRLAVSGVAGTMRRHVMAVAKQLGHSVQEVDANLSEMLASDEIFICNALLGVAPVIAVGDRHYPKGPAALQLQGILNS